MAMMDCIANGRCQHGDGGQGAGHLNPAAWAYLVRCSPGNMRVCT